MQTANVRMSWKIDEQPTRGIDSIDHVRKWRQIYGTATLWMMRRRERT